MMDVFIAEFYKFRGMFKRYYIDSISEIISYLILFVGLTFTIVSTTTTTQNMLLQLVIGIFIWYIGINAIAIFSFILQEEMQLGTLEQIYLTQTRLSQMLLGRAIGSFVFDAIGGVILSSLTMIVITMLGSNIPFQLHDLRQLFDLRLIIILIMTMIGIYGFSFILAGLSIIFKRISAISVILNYIFLFFTGLLLTDKTLPPLLDVFSKILPITWGIINIKDLLNENLHITHLIMLIVHSAIYLTLGLLIFHYCSYIARKKGTFNHY
ncbi:ABC transporter permease [Staphylococcus massiliensis]|uniref:ABC transporter permease n=1 Tax=Staphylococcus massiliensis TaxID=555791 RepID=UPI001EDCC7E8|nr:ABC transporter permease [Staphylococcus massiliensis]MCG3412368.1 ABC transporter permease [Staphylococcus massiliensis]